MTYHTNQVFLVAALTVAFSAVAVPPVPAIAQQALPPIFPTGIVYVWDPYKDNPAPQKLDIPGVPQSSHGTYRTQPYYAFVQDPATQKQYLVSDGQLKAELTLIPGSAGTRPKAADPTLVWRVAKYKLNVVRTSSATHPNFTDATVSFNDPGCGEELCFLISGTGDFAEFPSGDDRFTSYVVKKKKPDNTAKDNQTWGSSFLPKNHYEPIYYLTGCWDVTKLDYLDYQSQNCNEFLFELPDDDLKNYTRPTGEITLPFGWYYDSKIYSEAEETTTMIDTNRDVMNSVERTAGYNVSGSVDVSYGMVEAEASFSFNSSNGQMQKMATMQADKTVFTQNQYHHTAYAIAVQKIDLKLHSDFVDDVQELLRDLTAGALTDQKLKDFLRIYGTHYAYAITYGTQGAATYRLSEQQMSQLVEKGVSYSQAWEANAKVKVMGSGGSIGGGSSSSDDQKMQNQFASIVQDSEQNYTCSGGASCSGGTPTGEPNVPIFLDLRPISELLGPPFYDDPKIVLDLRDRVYDAIQNYAFVKLPPEKPRPGIVELTFQSPECRDQQSGKQAPDVIWDWNPFTVSAGEGSKLIPSANMQVSVSDPSGFTLDFANGAPTAILVPNGDTASLGGSANYYFHFGTDAQRNSTPLAFAPRVFLSQPGQTAELIGNSLVTYNDTNHAFHTCTPLLRVIAGPPNFAKLLKMQ